MSNIKTLDLAAVCSYFIPHDGGQFLLPNSPPSEGSLICFSWILIFIQGAWKNHTAGHIPRARSKKNGYPQQGERESEKGKVWCFMYVVERGAGQCRRLRSTFWQHQPLKSSCYLVGLAHTNTPAQEKMTGTSLVTKNSIPYRGYQRHTWTNRQKILFLRFSSKICCNI